MNFFQNFVLLQAAPASGGLGAMLPNLLLFGGMGLVMYFFMIRPQQQKAKNQKLFREALKKGDSVITIGGLHGKIVSVNENTITLEVDKGLRLLFEKSAISVEASKSAKPLVATELEIAEK